MQAISKPPVSVEELWAMNSCGYTRKAWVEMHRRKGYTLDNQPPRDFFAADVSKCSSTVSSFAAKAREGCPAGLLLSGKAGRGKTYAACAIIRAVQDCRSVGLATDAELVRAAKATFNDRNASEAQVIQRYTLPGVLVLDDFGKASYSSDWVLQLVFSVIDGRLRQGRTTIVTTQYDAAYLMSKLTVNGDCATAEAILSRFRTYEKAKLDGEDLRAAWKG